MRIATADLDSDGSAGSREPSDLKPWGRLGGRTSVALHAHSDGKVSMPESRPMSPRKKGEKQLAKLGSGWRGEISVLFIFHQGKRAKQENWAVPPQ